MKLRIPSLLATVAALATLPLGLFATQPLPEAVRLRIDLDRAILPAETPDKVIIKVSLDALRLPRGARPPVNLALVIDRSGSMAGDKIEKAREAALEVVRRLAPDDVFALVVFDTTVQTLVPAQRVGNGRALEEAICSIQAGSSTALFSGVSQGASEVRKHSENSRYIHRILLLSDGQANVGPSSPEELGRLGAALVKEGISVTTVGLGLGFNEDLMTRLAQRSDGNTYFVESSSDLPRIFNAELGDVLAVVARRVRIEIEFPDGVCPLRFVGREGLIRGQRAEIALNQLYGGQEKFLLIEASVPSAKAGAEREIARASVTFEDARDQKTTTLSAQSTVRYSNDRAASIRSANLKVQSDYAENVIAVAKDEAVQLVDANRKAEATQLMRARTQELQQMATTYSNAPAMAVAQKSLAETERLDRDGLDSTARKAYRADSAQTRNQQSSR
jgi:Ca-activated chloride channel homolog